MTIPAIFFGGAGGECISLEDKIIETLLKHVMLNLLVALHVLLAAKSFSTNVAVVKGRRVAPLEEKSGYFQRTWRIRNDKLPHE